MASQRIIDALNQARIRELTVIMQYMNHNYVASGLESPPAADALERIARVEMKHAEQFAERIVYLGGTPVTRPNEITKSEDLPDMLRMDLNAENDAIELYKGFITLCEQEHDPTTRLLFEEILAQEEEHANEFETLLGIDKRVAAESRSSM